MRRSAWVPPVMLLLMACGCSSPGGLTRDGAAADAPPQDRPPGAEAGGGGDRPVDAPADTPLDGHPDGASLDARADGRQDADGEGDGGVGDGGAVGDGGPSGILCGGRRCSASEYCIQECFCGGAALCQPRGEAGACLVGCTLPGAGAGCGQPCDNPGPRCTPSLATCAGSPPAPPRDRVVTCACPP
jgi:hypothetical protein